MAEAEDVIVDAARHATSFLQAQWRRRAPSAAEPATLAEHAQRLEFLLAAAFGRALKIRSAQPPAPPTLLRRLLERGAPRAMQALPATNGESVWLPHALDTVEAGKALSRYRIMALRQGMRALRGSPAIAISSEAPLVQDLYLVLEAHAADEALARMLPGTRTELPLPSLEVKAYLDPRPTRSPQESLERARALAEAMPPAVKGVDKDLWTGELREAPVPPRSAVTSAEAESTDKPLRSASLARTPKVREALPDEDETKPGTFMVQTAQPNESAEDPMGMQRPTDRDESTAAEDLAESLADLPEARLVTRPGTPKEVLLSAEPPKTRARIDATVQGSGIAYPEWDYRRGAYRSPGAIVRMPDPVLGDAAWAAATLERHAGLLGAVRRRFELLRAQRTRLRRQLDGEEIDLEACVEAAADYRAGLPRGERLYQTSRPARREMAIALLVDSSGSTDSWVSGNRRVIDVEREALLLVCVALETMREPYCVQAFSGEGPGAVSVRSLKGFDEQYGTEVARRIAGLEPERYTRVGAALRHTAAQLMREPAQHRLLLLLSDGKPNDVDQYEGRYGVEDMRQAVIEAKLQGIYTFCLTVDRAAAGYLPAVFGTRQYALLPRPDLLPQALLDWLRRLAMS